MARQMMFSAGLQWRPVSGDYTQALGIDPKTLTPADPDVVDAQATDVWLEMSVGPRWTAAARIVLRHGNPVIGELRVFPSESTEARRPGTWQAEVHGINARCPPGGLTARLVRQVPLRLFTKFYADMTARIDAGGEGPDAAEQLRGLGVRIRRVQIRPRRPSPTPAELAQVARAYVNAAKASNTPVKVVAQRRKESPARVRDMIYRARVDGLLTQGQRGKAGGVLTAKGRATLIKGIRPQRRPVARRSS